MTEKQIADAWLRNLTDFRPEAGNTPSQCAGVPWPRAMTLEELLASFTSAVALEAEKYLSLARAKLADDAMATVLLDARADEIRELYQVAALSAVRIWEDLAKTA